MAIMDRQASRENTADFMSKESRGEGGGRRREEEEGGRRRRRRRRRKKRRGGGKAREEEEGGRRRRRGKVFIRWDAIDHSTLGEGGSQDVL